MIPSDFNLGEFLVSMVALVICITIHEFAHAYTAWKAGDETPKQHGRISLNPLDHLDPIGTIMMVVSSISGFGIGWGKPVRINPYNFRRPRWDNMRVSLWGPLSNVITALVLGLVIRFWGGHMNPETFRLVDEIVVISLVLAFFNLIPISPLDGSHIMSSLLPTELARQYDAFMARFGMMVFLGLIFLAPHALSSIIGPPVEMCYRLFVG